MDQIDDPITPDTGHVNGMVPDDAAMTAESVGLRPGFLAELAVAMRATAERERANIGKRVEEDAAGHIEKVRARAAIETEELRRLAEEDVQHIEEWSAAEMERIRAEADQKIGDRRTSLDEYLRQHDAIIDTEIEGVDAAVRDYNSTLDRFFAELSESDDPSAIVARAETLPAPPDLDQVRAQARASAVAMFVQPDAEEAAPEADAVAEATADAVSDTDADTPMGTAGSVEAESVATEAVAAEAPDATTDAAAEATPTETVDEVRAEAAPAAEPVPVMDPTATADTSWPATE
jgi:hypothetical protein